MCPKFQSYVSESLFLLGVEGAEVTRIYGCEENCENVSLVKLIAVMADLVCREPYNSFISRVC